MEHLAVQRQIDGVNIDYDLYRKSQELSTS